VPSRRSVMLVGPRCSVKRSAAATTHDRFNFEQKLRFDETIDDQQRVPRIMGRFITKKT